ncbi:DUF2637 domain-containing protein [Rhodococcus sp. PAMC28707]|uniref:DUF2637 domain-containing protein n=1 Tax=unclassified Rhodococcus (in: high G+C Gram-positive bacteria) TaxID=192944 RepID=UPI00109E2206|nr:MULTISPECIES: DUF2637 domain-containing protein [unclassified Rhodococcus (in: high G+C Gram-positive bacteria)]QCB49102.1 DUF2637 domain-containing protein [Rhodococcus sp. PAMC28705]QCB59210.1 DUF2637 domain-containing protein [Rhodococcus sp. PAMC28707]
MNKVLRVTLVSAVVITTVIGIASFVLSFAALWDLATMAGVPRNLSWLWPVIVDGTILQATISVIALAQFADQRSGRRFFWWVLVIAALVSIGANALHAFTSNTGTLHPALSAAIATVAPVSLLAATHGLGILVRIPSTQPGPVAAVQPEKTAARDVESVGPDLPQSPPIPVVHATPENTDPIAESQRGAEPQGVELSDGIEDVSSAEPLDSVDRWILDGDRIEDLYPVDAP